MFWSVIFSNIIGFDGLIFLTAAADAAVFAAAKKAAGRLYGAMHKEIYAPSCGSDIHEAAEDIEKLTDKKVSAMRAAAVSRYTLYVNLTGIFPLLGILGTVISLIGIVGNTSGIEGSFFAALTSTFWGLVFAILFKVLDGSVSPVLDDGERAAELFMQRRAEQHPDSDIKKNVLDIFKDSGSTEPETEESYEAEK